MPISLPVFRGAGAKASGTTGEQSVPLPTGIVIGDICVLVATTIAGGTVTISTVGGGTWTAVTGSPIDVTSGEKLYVWYRRHASGDSAPGVTPGSDHVCAGTSAWYNCIASGSPIDNQETGSETSSDTSFSFATTISTGTDNCMCVAVCSTGADKTAAQFSTMTNTSLTSLAERIDYCTNSGGGGGFALNEGAKATAGVVGTWESTLDNATPKAYITFALKGLVLQDASKDFSAKFKILSAGSKDISAAFGVEAPPGWLSGWFKRIQLTVDHTDIDENLVNFPVLVLISTASGIGNADVSEIFDDLGSNSLKIAVTTSNGTTQCYVEVESWNSVAETAYLWVLVPAISGTISTDLYLYWDASHSDNTTYVGAIDSTPGRLVWSTDGNFKGVYHLAEASGDVIDSVNLTDLTNEANLSYGQTGAIDGAIDFNGSNARARGAAAIYTTGQTALTFEGWCKIDSFPGGTNQKNIFYSGDNGEGQLCSQGTDAIRVAFHLVTSGFVNVTVTGYSTGTWYHVTGVWINDDKVYLYVNGSLAGSSADIPNEALYDPGTTFLPTIGAYGYTTGSEWFDGIIDEVRVSTTNRSAAWIKATYQTSIDDLLTWGTTEINSGSKDLSASFRFPTLPWSDGFENGFNEPTTWTGHQIDSGCSATVVSDVQHHGSNSAKFTTTDNAWSGEYKEWGGTNSEIYVRFYLRFDTMPINYASERFLAIYDNNHSGIIDVMLYYESTGPAYYIRVYNDITTLSYYVAIPSFAVNTWYCLEVYVKVADSPNGAFKTWWNGVLKHDQTGIDTKSTGDYTDWAYVGNLGSDKAGSHWIDCVKVETSYIGTEETLTSASKDLSAKLVVLQSSSKDLSTKFKPLKSDTKDFSAKVKVLKSSLSDFSGKFKLLYSDSGDLSSKFIPLQSSSKDLSTRFKPLYSTSRDFSSVFKPLMPGSKDISGHLHILKSSDLDLSGKLVPEKSSFIDFSTKFKPLKSSSSDFSARLKPLKSGQVDFSSKLKSLKSDYSLISGKFVIPGLQSADKDYSAVFDVLKTSLVSLSGKLKILESSSKDFSTAFKVLQSQFSTLSGKVKVLKSSLVDFSAKFKPLYSSSKDFSGKLKALFSTFRTFSSKFKVLKSSSTDYSVRFKVLKTSLVDLSATFKPLYSAFKDISSLLKVLTSSSEDFHSSFKLPYYGSKTVSATFKVVGIFDDSEVYSAKFKLLIPDSKDFSTKFKVLKTASIDESARFKPLYSVSKDFSGKFKPLISSTKDLSGKIKVLKSSERDFSGKIKILTSSSKDISGKFKPLYSTSKDESARFKPLKSSFVDLSARFKPQYSTFKDFSTKFKVLFSASKDESAKITVLHSGSSNFSASFNILTLEVHSFDSTSFDSQSFDTEISLYGSDKDFSSRFRLLSSSSADMGAKLKPLKANLVDFSAKFKPLYSVFSDFSAKLMPMHSTYRDFSAKFVPLKTETKDLSARLKPLKSDLVDISGKVNVLKPGLADVSGKFKPLKSDSRDESAKLKLPYSDSRDLSAKFKPVGIFYDEKDYSARVKVLKSASVDYSSLLRVLKSSLTDLSTKLKVLTSGSVDFRGKVISIHSTSLDFSTRIKVLKGSLVDISAKFKPLYSSLADISAKLAVLKSNTVDLSSKFAVQKAGTLDYSAKFVVLTPSLTVFHAQFWILGVTSVDLQSTFMVGSQSSTSYHATFWVVGREEEISFEHISGTDLTTTTDSELEAY